MTEQEWLAATDPKSMLESLKGKASNRKLNLFAIACHYFSCRGGAATNPVEMYEAVVRFADGQLSLDQVRGYWTREWGTGRYPPVGHSLPERPFEWVDDIIALARAYREEAKDYSDVPTDAEFVSMFHEIFGNPFRPVTADPAWRTSAVLDLATRTYDEKAFRRLASLADALHDAGCDNDNILSHCRSTAPHVRGCWVVDLVLGKG